MSAATYRVGAPPRRAARRRMPTLLRDVVGMVALATAGSAVITAVAALV